MHEYEYGTIVESHRQGKPEVLGEKPDLISLSESNLGSLKYKASVPKQITWKLEVTNNKLKIGFVTEGCWYHLQTTCTVASHKLVWLENLTHKDRQLTVQHALSTSISCQYYQTLLARWVPKQITADKALQIRPNLNTT